MAAMFTTYKIDLHAYKTYKKAQPSTKYHLNNSSLRNRNNEV